MEHSRGVNHKSYTYSRRPVTCVFSEMYTDPELAIRIEKQIKGWSRKKKEALIAKDFYALHELAKCKNKTSHLNIKKNG